jgi:hypothetical protein
MANNTMAEQRLLPLPLQGGGGCPAAKSERTESVMRARRVALRIAGHASSTDVGAEAVDGAPHMLADLATEGRAAIVLAAHTAFVQGHEGFRNQGEVFFRFQGESRPALVIGAAGAAALAG